MKKPTAENAGFPKWHFAKLGIRSSRGRSSLGESRKEFYFVFGAEEALFALPHNQI
jgi:hypothetical protein